MLHWDFIAYLLLGVVMGGVKGRFEKRALLSPALRPWLALALPGVMIAVSVYKLQPDGVSGLLQTGVNTLAGMAALWFAFSWARWFFGPVRWS